MARRWSSELFGLSNVSPTLVIGVISGHCPISVYAISLILLPDASCRSWSEDELETSKPFIFTIVGSDNNENLEMKAFIKFATQHFFFSKLRST